jgi:hypothetical protein
MRKHKWVVWWKCNGFLSRHTLNYESEFQENEIFTNFFSAMKFFIGKKLEYVGIIKDVENFEIKITRI